ncbi:DnaD domain protein, partial [Eubacterium sp.]|uniref:DnaD domain protein n=1 Tax=Eubacterium sp. TaxID=142586 RepID=UPI003EFE81CB
EDFDIQMIAIACDIMKENTDKPTLRYVDIVLKNWKKKGIFTPDAVAKQEKEFHEKKEARQKPAIDETYDINEINRRAMLNDDYDI